MFDVNGRFVKKDLQSWLVVKKEILKKSSQSNSSADQTEANKDIHKIAYVEIKGNKVGIAD